MSGSWWSTVWSSAVAGDAFSDTSQIESGRNLARRNVLPPVELEPGLAVLRDDAWVAQLGIRLLDDSSWERIWRVVADDAMQSAAVLTGELPPEVFGLAVRSGVSIGPGPGDLSSDCSCHDWREPCKHVGAICELVAQLIEADPWVLMLLRGRDRSAVVDQVRALRASARGMEVAPVSDEPRGPDPGVAAAASFRRVPGPIPGIRPLLRGPGSPIAIEPLPPVDSGVAVADLERLVADASTRAAQMLAGDLSSSLTLTPHDDLARLAAEVRSEGKPLTALAEAVDADSDDLERLAMAWSVGGAAGVAVASNDGPIEQPDPRQLDRAVTALGDGARRNGNIATLRSVQLRIDDDQRWWRFEAHDRLGWTLAAGGFEDPADAIL